MSATAGAEAKHRVTEPRSPIAVDRVVAPSVAGSHRDWYTAAQRRDSLYRRLLAAADLIAVALAIIVATQATGDGSVTLAAVSCR